MQESPYHLVQPAPPPFGPGLRVADRLRTTARDAAPDSAGPPREGDRRRALQGPLDEGALSPYPPNRPFHLFHPMGERVSRRVAPQLFTVHETGATPIFSAI